MKTLWSFASICRHKKESSLALSSSFKPQWILGLTNKNGGKTDSAGLTLCHVLPFLGQLSSRARIFQPARLSAWSCIMCGVVDGVNEGRSASHYHLLIRNREVQEKIKHVWFSADRREQIPQWAWANKDSKSKRTQTFWVSVGPFKGQKSRTPLAS